MKIYKLIFFSVIFGFVTIGCNSDTETDSKTTSHKINNQKSKKKKIALPVKGKNGYLKFLKGKRKEKSLTNGVIGRIGSSNIKNGNKSQKPIVILNNKEIVVSGFAFDKLADKTAQTVYVVVDGKFYKAKYGGKRDWVVKTRKNNKFLNTGFDCSIPVLNFEKGIHKARIIIVSNDGSYYYEPGQLVEFYIK